MEKMSIKMEWNEKIDWDWSPLYAENFNGMEWNEKIKI